MLHQTGLAAVCCILDTMDSHIATANQSIDQSIDQPTNILYSRYLRLDCCQQDEQLVTEARMVGGDWRRSETSDGSRGCLEAGRDVRW